MKKKWLIYVLIVVVLLIGIVLGIKFWPRKSLNYDKLLKGAERSYGVNISYFNEDDIVNISGEYDSNTNELSYETLEDDGSKRTVNYNLYDIFVKLLPNKNYANEASEAVTLKSTDIFGNLKFLKLRYKASSFDCTYDITDNIVYAISCEDSRSGEELISIDFVFE